MSRRTVALNDVDEAAWSEARRREAVLRALVGRKLSRPEREEAAAALGLRVSQLYRLLAAYTTRPVASTLLPSRTGPQQGAHRRLSPAVEAVIAAQIAGCYRTRNKPTLARLEREVRDACIARLQAPTRRTR